MKICLFSPRFGSLGGMEQVSQNLAREFTLRGHQVLVVTAPEDAGRAPAIRDVKVYGFPLAKLPAKIRRASRWARYAGSFPPSARAIRALAARERPHMVLMNCHRARAGYANCFPHAATTVVLQNWAPPVSPWDGWNLRRWLTGRQWIFCCSDAVRLQAIGEVPEIQDRCETVHNGFRPDEFKGSTPCPFERPYVFAYGRLDFGKGFDLVIQAFRQIAEEVRDVDLLIAGEGREMDSLRRAAGDLNNRILFYGPVRHDEVPSLLRGSLFVVVPSRHEAFGIANLEAMASAKAVIAARVGGIPEIVVDGETGVLVPPEDPKPLAEAMRRLLREPELRERMGHRGRSRALERFTWPVLAEQYLARFESLLNPAPARARGRGPEPGPISARQRSAP